MKGLTTVKQGKATTVQDRSGKFLTEERQILNRWTEYCSELYNHKASGDPSVLNCTQTDTEDDHPILRSEVEAAVQSLKKGKSAGVHTHTHTHTHAHTQKETHGRTRLQRTGTRTHAH